MVWRWFYRPDHISGIIIQFDDDDSNSLKERIKKYLCLLEMTDIDISAIELWTMISDDDYFSDYPGIVAVAY